MINGRRHSVPVSRCLVERWFGSFRGAMTALWWIMIVGALMQAVIVWLALLGKVR